MFRYFFEYVVSRFAYDWLRDRFRGRKEQRRFDQAHRAVSSALGREQARKALEDDLLQHYNGGK